MNELVSIFENQAVVSSREIAVNFGKEHRSVIRNVQEIITAQNRAVIMFYETTYKSGTGKNYKMYLMNRDGFSLLAMGFTGKKALAWKLKYIEAFNKMEAALKNQKELALLSFSKRIDELEQSIPLFAIDCKELQAAVRKIGINVLGGKDSLAYKDASVRGKVYSDIQRQLRREFDVERYEAIKHQQFGTAKDVVLSYRLPLVLREKITDLNKEIA